MSRTARAAPPTAATRWGHGADGKPMPSSLAAGRLELTATERQRVIGEYITSRGDWARAAEAVGLSVAQLAARFAANDSLFGDCMSHDAEWRPPAGATWSLGGGAPGGSVQWTAAVREQFLETYVNTGDVAEARDQIGATPAQLNRELAANDEFAAAVAAAKPMADQVLKERATQMALAGNEKLLTLVLKAQFPEYRDNLKIDLKSEQTVRLSDELLEARIARLQQRLGVTIDGECPKQKGTRGAIAAPRRKGTPRKAEQVSDAILS